LDVAIGEGAEPVEKRLELDDESIDEDFEAGDDELARAIGEEGTAGSPMRFGPSMDEELVGPEAGVVITAVQSKDEKTQKMEEVPTTTGPRYWYFYCDAEAWASHMGGPAVRHGETHKVQQYR
jgi:hypothetical protein